MNSRTIKEIKTQLREETNQFRDLFKDILSEFKSYGFHNHLLLSVCKRAIDIVDTISYSTRKYNLNTQYPLIRLQIYNCLLLQAALLLKDNNDFFADLNERDFQFRKYSFPGTSEKMSERKLAKSLTNKFPSFLDKYEYCCDFVHFTGLSFDLAVRDAKNFCFYMSEEVGNSEVKYRIKLSVENLLEINKVVIYLINKCRHEFAQFKYGEI